MNNFRHQADKPHPALAAQQAADKPNPQHKARLEAYHNLLHAQHPARPRDFLTREKMRAEQGTTGARLADVLGTLTMAIIFGALAVCAVCVVIALGWAIAALLGWTDLPH